MTAPDVSFKKWLSTLSARFKLRVYKPTAYVIFKAGWDAHSHTQAEVSRDSQS